MVLKGSHDTEKGHVILWGSHDTEGGHVILRGVSHDTEGFR